MFEMGLYGSVFVNKRGYLPTGIYGYGINFHYKKISDHDCL